MGLKGMMGRMILLGDEKRKNLKIQHKKERDGRIRDRIKAILLHDKGWSIQSIAEALILSDDAIRKHIFEYKEAKKLKPENGGSSSKLSLKQSERLIEHLKKHTYLYTKDIVTYVQSITKISYTVRGMYDWLKRNGFSYKKPALVPGKATIEQQQKWINEYTKLNQNLPENEAICFMDGVHPTHNVQSAYGWIETGVRKTIPTNSGLSRLNLSGAIDIANHKILVQEDKTLNANATIHFLKKIEAAYPTKNCIHLFCDNATYYRNKDVTIYLKSSKIHLHFLPPYSPNLNPIERLWKWMKERIIYTTYYKKFENFKSAVIGFFTFLSSLSPESSFAKNLKTRITDHFTPIGL